MERKDSWAFKKFQNTPFKYIEKSGLPYPAAHSFLHIIFAFEGSIVPIRVL